MKKNRPIIPMPKIQPIQYPTEELSFFRRALRWIAYTRKWRVVEDYYFTLPDGTRVVIPQGFEFDGASVPKIFRFLLSPTGCLFIAGLFHDYGYRYDELIGVNDDGSRYSYMPGEGKMFWDNLFRKIADQTNGLIHVNKISCSMLSLFGFLAWNAHRGRIPTMWLIN